MTNPERKKPFDIRSLMNAVIDQDHAPLERWATMADADTVVVYDAHLGGIPVTLLGIESRPINRYGFLPADGPDQWMAGTLFPLSSKKAARAINAASGNRPVVVLANLSGFDGSPESLRKRQLEYGAEIGRAVVNFSGPIVFCVVSRYHGGAFVVFSGALSEEMDVLAVEGSYASVIGGAPPPPWCSLATWPPALRPTHEWRRFKAGWPARRTRTAAGCGPNSMMCGRRSGPRSSGRSQRSSMRFTAFSGPRRSDRWMPFSRQADFARVSSRRWNAVSRPAAQAE